VFHDIDPLTKVTAEDILSVVAEKVPVLQREPVKDHDSSFTPFSRGAWWRRDAGISASPVKSIHHFCVLPDGLRLPVPFRGIWQQHHRQVSLQVSDPAL